MDKFPQIDHCLWHITQKCGNKCSRCRLYYHPKTNLSDSTLEDQTVILSQLELLSVKRIEFIGAEPLCSPNLFELAHLAKDRGFFTILKITPTLYKMFASRIVSTIDLLSISLEGWLYDIFGQNLINSGSNPQFHDKNLEKWDEFKEMLQLSLKMDQKSFCSLTLSNSTIDLLPELIEIFENFKIPLDIFITQQFQKRTDFSQIIHLFGSKKAMYYTHIHYPQINLIENPVCASFKSIIAISPNNGLYYPCFFNNQDLLCPKPSEFAVFIRDLILSKKYLNPGEYSECSKCDISIYLSQTEDSNCFSS